MSKSFQNHLDRLDYLRRLPLQPSNYCDRWVRTEPYQGYRKACIHALAKATGLSHHTIKDWGTDFSKCPKYVPYLLRQVDLLNQIQEMQKHRQIHLPINKFQE